jgi:hypothetical protein
MAEKDKTITSEPKPSARWLWTLQGVTLVGVLGSVLAGGIWVGGIQEKLTAQSEKLDKISDAIFDSSKES